MNTALLYVLVGIALAALGLRTALLAGAVLRKLVAINIMGVGVFLVLIATAYDTDSPDAVPHALVLTGIVVAVSATALGLALLRRLSEGNDDDH
jgi:multicomponent Na+:H+ antiporter subunit C